RNFCIGPCRHRPGRPGTCRTRGIALRHRGTGGRGDEVVQVLAVPHRLPDLPDRLAMAWFRVTPAGQDRVGLDLGHGGTDGLVLVDDLLRQPGRVGFEGRSVDMAGGGNPPNPAAMQLVRMARTSSGVLANHLPIQEAGLQMPSESRLMGPSPEEQMPRQTGPRAAWPAAGPPRPPRPREPPAAPAATVGSLPDMCDDLVDRRGSRQAN